MQERDCGYTPAWSIFCLSLWWRSIFRCARSFSTLLRQVVYSVLMVFFFSTRPRFPYCRQKSFPTIVLWGKVRQRDRNWFKWVMPSDKKNGFESHLLVQIAVLFKFSTFFQQSSNCILIQDWYIPSNKKAHVTEADSPAFIRY